jgi:hypothetical protein
LEEQEFIARFNNLIKALQDFGSAYKLGQVVDVKKASGSKGNAQFGKV